MKPVSVPVPGGLKAAFFLYGLLAALLGVVLLAMPGRFLGWVGWEPIDPIGSRFLGAALLALAWACYAGSRAESYRQALPMVQAQALFTTLAAVGLLRHLLVANFPVGYWALLGVLLFWALVWIIYGIRRLGPAR